MKIQKQIILFTINFLLLLGCSSTKEKLIPTYNEGGYKIKIIKLDSKINELRIRGKVYDVKNKLPLSDVELAIGCLKVKSLPNGEYSFLLKKDLKDSIFFIEAISIGYKSIETNLLSTVDRNEIIIDFYLSEDDRPLINCEGFN